MVGPTIAAGAFHWRTRWRRIRHNVPAVAFLGWVVPPFVRITRQSTSPRLPQLLGRRSRVHLHWRTRRGGSDDAVVPCCIFVRRSGRPQLQACGRQPAVVERAQVGVGRRVSQELEREGGTATQRQRHG
jgi:hypothetical protein